MIIYWKSQWNRNVKMTKFCFGHPERSRRIFSPQKVWTIYERFFMTQGRMARPYVTKAKTAADGSATIRGFYGDYDVTVTANGKTVTEMVSFHKGYDNTFTVVVE